MDFKTHSEASQSSAAPQDPVLLKRIRRRNPGFVGDEGPVGDYVLAVESLTKVFENNQSLYRAVDLKVRQGEILVIVGQSGIGKSVLLKHLIGLMDPTEGHVWYAYRHDGLHPVDVPVEAMDEDSMAGLRLEVGMVFQESSLFDWMSVAENIGLPLEEHHDRVVAMAQSFQEDLGLFLRILDAPHAPPTSFAQIRQGLAGRRATLEERLDDLVRHVGESVDGLEQFTAALGYDRALELGLAARHDSVNPDAGAPDSGEPGSTSTDPAGGEECPVMALIRDPFVIGSVLETVSTVDLPDQLVSFVNSFREARDSVHREYHLVRERWSPPFRELGNALTRWTVLQSNPALDSADATQWVSEARKINGQIPRDEAGAHAWAARKWLTFSGLALPDTQHEALSEVLRALKSRPDRLRGIYKGHESRDDADPLKEFLGAVDSMRSRLELNNQEIEHLKGNSLGKARILAWLTTHPVDLDRGGDIVDLTQSLVRALRGRGHELGGVLATAPLAGKLTAPIQAVREAYLDLARSLKEAMGQMIDRLPQAQLVDETIQLIVHGLMETFRLVVERDSDKLPSELSGGMKKRVGMARSLALMPKVVLYDEPTAGLDPILAKSIAREILNLQTAGVVTTSVVVTHDKSLYSTLKTGGRTRLVYLSEGVLFDRSGHLLVEPMRPGDGSPAPDRTESGAGDEQAREFVREFEPDLTD